MPSQPAQFHQGEYKMHTKLQVSINDDNDINMK